MMEVPNTAGASFEEDAQFVAAKKKALDLLNYQPLTFARLVEKLREREFSEELAQAAAERMQELGLVNDEEYARRSFRYYSETKCYGARRVRQEMLHKGVPSDIISRVFEETDVDWIALALVRLRKKYPDANDNPKAKNRAYGGLARYGFSPSEIRNALTELESTENEEQYDE